VTEVPWRAFVEAVMTEMLQVPADVITSLAELRLPSKADQLLQSLMDRNNEGQLSPEERDELEALAELSENLSLVRARALGLLGKTPA
jgi:hypothetical protein